MKLGNQNMQDSEKVANILVEFEEIVKKPDKFIGTENEAAEKIEGLIKEIYDFTKNTEEKIISHVQEKSDVLPTLLLEGFDPEQIWSQINLQNDAALDKVVSDVASLLAKKKLVFTTREKVIEDTSSKSSILKKKVKNKNVEKEIKSKPVKSKKGSIVDDKFFKLSEMENFLNKMEKDEEDGNDDSDEDIDYFADDEKRDASRYQDFFDEPEGEMEGDSINDDTKSSEESDLSDGNESNEDVENYSEDEDENEEEEEVEGEEEEGAEEQEMEEEEFNDEEEDLQYKSSFEARQERIKARISALEDEALREKPWQLKGEVTGHKRPQNSLLEEYVEFDVASRPAPIITEKTTLKLEDVIRQRIKDKVWDDVIRKIKPVEDPKEYKKKLILNQEKSKLSLSEIYEREYLKEKSDKEKNEREVVEEESNNHAEIKKAVKILFAKLDALSNFHYTPKQVTPEVRITSHLPAVVVEEVAPVATSDATLLAPEEVKSKQKGDLIGKSERTATDKKRERRKKILRQRSKKKEKEQREKLVEKLQPGMGNKYSKEKVKGLLEKVSKEQNVSLMDQNGSRSSAKSSSAFFSKLQNEVGAYVKRKAKDVTDSDKKKKFSAKKIKL